MALTPKKQGELKTPATDQKGANRAPGARTGANRGRLTEHDDYISPMSMTGIRTGLLNSAVTKAVLALLIFIFAGTFLLGGLTGNAPQLGDPGAQGPRGSGPDPVAQVAGEDIPRARFEQVAQGQAQQMAMFGQTIGPCGTSGFAPAIFAGTGKSGGAIPGRTGSRHHRFPMQKSTPRSTRKSAIKSSSSRNRIRRIFAVKWKPKGKPNKPCATKCASNSTEMPSVAS
jgi:hypothetical protein